MTPTADAEIPEKRPARSAERESLSELVTEFLSTLEV
jgi:hypothetical protein